MSLTYNCKLTLGCLAFAALSLLAAHPIQAQTTVTGNYDSAAIGYIGEAAGSPYTVTSPATFNSDTAYGFDVYGSTVTVTGGKFDNDGAAGILVRNSTLNISNAEDVGDNKGLEASSSNVTITGGTFSGNTTDFYSIASNITIYGNFNEYGVLGPGSGTFMGYLEGDTVDRTFTYTGTSGGTITLVQETVPTVPEPSPIALFGLGALGLIGLGVRGRKRGSVHCG